MRLAQAAMGKFDATPYYFFHTQRSAAEARQQGRTKMHELVERIHEPDLCYVFARNATRRGHPELALQAYRRAVDLRAQQHGAESEAELAALRAIYAYEEALSYSRGKRTRATGTWQMVNRNGLLHTIHRRLQSSSSEEVAPILKELGMEDYSFAAVARNFPQEVQQAAA